MPKEAAKNVKTGDLLYFIRQGDFVKIGRTNDLDGRISTLQCGSPHEIDEAIGIIGAGHEEKRWHEMLAIHRVRGEWFRWCHEIEYEMRWAIRKAQREFQRVGT